MADERYPDRWSDVEVIMTDGTIETHRIKAGAGIGQYMAGQAGRDNVLTLLCGGVVYSYPLSSVRNWIIRELPDEKPE